MKKKESLSSSFFLYEDEAGNVLFRVEYYGDFFPKDGGADDLVRRYAVQDPGGEWVAGQPPVIPPYNLRALYDRPEQVVIIAGDEFDVEALSALGSLATCGLPREDGGCFPMEWRRHFSGRLVIVLDSPFSWHKDIAEQAYQALVGVAKELRVLRLGFLQDVGRICLGLRGFSKETWQSYLYQAAADDKTTAKYAKAHEFGASLGLNEYKSHMGDAYEGDLPEVETAVTDEDTHWKPFPVKALPHVVAEFVEEIARSIQVDPVAVALPALCAMAGAIGNSRVIRLKRTWSEPAIMFGCLIADPSTRKTAALEAAIAPVKKWNSEKLREHRDALERYEHDLEIWLAMSQKDSPDGAVRRKPTPPPKRRCMVQDITVETLIRELQNNPRGLLVKRDELRGWFASFGRYAKSGAGADESFWLEVRGTNFDYDRKTGDQASIHIEHLTVSVVGTTQPETWKGLASQAMFDSGMVARILLAYPPKQLGTFNGADPNEGVLRLYDHLLRSLLELDWDRCQQPDWHPLPMVFTPEALNAWTVWCDEGRRAQFRADGEVASLLGKLEAYCARFALCFGCCDRVLGGTDDVIEEVHVRNAITIADWFHDEILRIYSATRMGETEAEAARILQKIQDMGGSITPRELWHSNRVKWGANTSPKDRSVRARVALEMLAEEGRLIKDQRGRFFLPKGKK